MSFWRHSPYRRQKTLDDLEPVIEPEIKETVPETYTVHLECLDFYVILQELKLLSTDRTV